MKGDIKGKRFQEPFSWYLSGKGGRPRMPLGHENQNGLSLPT
jgi:hypothetical protein